MSVRRIDPRDRKFNWYAGGGDAVAKIAIQVAENTLPQLAKIGSSFVPDAVMEVAKEMDLPPGFLWKTLFNVRMWPRNLSIRATNGLSMLKYMYEFLGAPRRTWMSRGTDPDLVPKSAFIKIDEALERLSIRGRKAKFDGMKIVFKNVRSHAPLVQDVCAETLGEPCTAKEAEEILYGDLTSLAAFGRLPHSTMFQALLE
jgi:hypothetical protein